MDPQLLLQSAGENNPQKLTVAAGLLAGSASFKQETVDQILAELLRSLAGDDKRELLAWAESLAGNANTAYLCAQLAAASGNIPSALVHWERLLSLTPERDPLVLLSYATALSAQGRAEEAASTLRRALLPVPRY